MPEPAVVAIGASEGGVAALRHIVAGLDARVPAIWCVVLHTDAHPSHLPEILDQSGPLPVRHAEQGEVLQQGRIYVAPPDHHFLVCNGSVRLTRGPRVNWTRPAIDPLFQSTAEDCGARAIGVILTGNLNDGTRGLHEIRRRGGCAVVQDPMEAESAGMPTSALAQAGADHCVTLAEMPTLLCRLATEVASRETMTAMEAPMTPDSYRLDRPTSISCPDCGGVMACEPEGPTTLYRCHIGHTLTIETLLHAKRHVLEEKLGACLVVLKERAELCHLMNEMATREGRDGSRFDASRAQSLKQAEAVRTLLEDEWVHPGEKIGRADPEKN